MTSYGQLFLVLLPVFAMIGIGAALRHWQWISEEGENSLFNVVIRVTTPCLIFESVASNPALREPGNLYLPQGGQRISAVVGGTRKVTLPDPPGSTWTCVGGVPIDGEDNHHWLSRTPQESAFTATCTVI